MIIEYIRYRVADSAAFEAAYRRAAVALQSSPYCRTYDLARCAEEPKVYILQLTWTSASDHLEEFRGSPEFRAFFAEIKDYVGDIEEMRHYEPVALVPSLYEWAGGAEAFENLFVTFYRRVDEDPVLAPVFAGMHPDHPKHVAAWLGEVFGGPAVYSERYGGHQHMVSRHRGRELTEEQRQRWTSLLLDTADKVGLPADAEFRSAFVGYLEWGTRMATLFSGADAPDSVAEPMPTWGWGEVRPWPRT
ncbi:group II truncated hemoglobin [Nocardia carnea]|uniref:group II truncated hemoglobin n=1 Tax=Nocardia carnea TaxID=37328 RepID=UPI002458BA0C|nr:antibiotic biosynthesis monooxygenase [Nocardia carnea]